MIKVQSRESFLEVVSGFLPENPIAAELGVFQGDFSEMIFKILNPYRLYLIDPFKIGTATYGPSFNNQPIAYSTEADYKILKERIEADNEFAQVAIIHKKYSHEAVHSFRNNEIDFIYHDASHHYYDVKLDLKGWLPKLKPGGIMAGHDYINLHGFGVIQAVDEFCTENNFEMIILNENGGDFALKRK